MQKVIKIIVLFLVISLVIFSCEKDITLELNKEHSRFCLNCILEAGTDSVVIFVTKTTAIEDSNTFEPITNAQIELRKESELLTGMVNKGNGKYVFRHKPESGKKYEILAVVGENNFMTAETTVPFPPDCNARFIQDTILDSHWYKGYRTINRFAVEINDLQTKDYYWLQTGTIKNYGIDFTNSYYTDKIYFDEFNRYFYQDSNYPFTSYEYIGALRLDDSLFPESKIQFSISGRPPKTIFIYNADIHFDKYYKSSIKQFLTYEYEGLPIFEPIQIYSNIKNGLGIFGSIAVTKIYIDANI